MSHYKLPSPANPNTTLTKRGSSWDATIYHCEATNTFWLLHMDRSGNRFLYAYILGGEKPVIDKSQRHSVPADWTGDPETVYVSLESIRDSATAADAVNLPAGFEEMLDNGDRILVTDFENAVVGEVVKRDNSVVFVRREGFEI